MLLPELRLIVLCMDKNSPMVFLKRDDFPYIPIDSDPTYLSHILFEKMFGTRCWEPIKFSQAYYDNRLFLVYKAILPEPITPKEGGWIEISQLKDDNAKLVRFSLSI